ncbi:hypothetical protein QJS04_geneDACA004996 [Acorus gramineus]|uniref:Uncharacterized protein n=1 Tax=Acorus gramineus TaxID=55184 RepID=A0AAV9AXM5_ACOGR|nr:hypothetical protein QJS04_geneDACA004996 [Acorus gramineus]
MSARAPNVCAESPPCSSESSEDKNGKCDVDEVKSEVEEVKSESSEDENGKSDVDEVKSDVEEVKCDDEEVCIVSSTP